jgi:hypothetical protein
MMISLRAGDIWASTSSMRRPDRKSTPPPALVRLCVAHTPMLATRILDRVLGAPDDYQGVDRDAAVGTGDQGIHVQCGQPWAEVDSQVGEAHDRVGDRV